MLSVSGFAPASVLVGVLAVAASPSSSQWSGFRNGGGAPIKARRLPVSWSPQDGVAWGVRLPGYGQSAPAVKGNQLFVTSVPGRKREKCVVQALDAKTGHVSRPQLSN
jgi:hypothetical protein